MGSGQLNCRQLLYASEISTEDQRDVPQYMTHPWSMTWFIARTTSVFIFMAKDNLSYDY